MNGNGQSEPTKKLTPTQGNVAGSALAAFAVILLATTLKLGRK
jgi:hypothetical protein